MGSTTGSTVSQPQQAGGKGPSQVPQPQYQPQYQQMPQQATGKGPAQQSPQYGQQSAYPQYGQQQYAMQAPAQYPRQSFNHFDMRRGQQQGYGRQDGYGQQYQQQGPQIPGNIINDYAQNPQSFQTQQFLNNTQQGAGVLGQAAPTNFDPNKQG